MSIFVSESLLLLKTQVETCRGILQYDDVAANEATTKTAIELDKEASDI